MMPALNAASSGSVERTLGVGLSALCMLAAGSRPPPPVTVSSVIAALHVAWCIGLSFFSFCFDFAALVALLFDVSTFIDNAVPCGRPAASLPYARYIYIHRQQ